MPPVGIKFSITFLESSSEVILKYLKPLIFFFFAVNASYLSTIRRKIWSVNVNMYIKRLVMVFSIVESTRGMDNVILLKPLKIFEFFMT